MKRFFGHQFLDVTGQRESAIGWKLRNNSYFACVLHFPALRLIFAELFPKMTLRNKPSGLPPVRLPPLSVRTSVCFVRVWRRVRSHLTLVQREKFICVTFYNDKISFSFCWRTIVSVPPRLNSSAWLNSAAKPSAITLCTEPQLYCRSKARSWASDPIWEASFSLFLKPLQQLFFF